MKRSHRKPSEGTLSTLLCLEQLESRLPLTAIWVPQSFGGERFDVSSRDDSAELVRVHDGDSQTGRSGTRGESGDQARPSDGMNRENYLASNAIESIQRSVSNRNLGDQLRNASDGTVGRLGNESNLPRTLTSRSGVGSKSLITGSARTTSSADTAPIVRAQPAVETDSSVETQTPFIVSLSVRVPDASQLVSATSAPQEANSGLPAAASGFRNLSDAGHAGISLPNRLIPFVRWFPEDESDDQTPSDSTESVDTETIRFGGVVGLERMPLLQDTLPLIRNESTTINSVVDAISDEEGDDLRFLNPEFSGDLDGNDSAAKSLPDEEENTPIPHSRTPPSHAAEAIDTAIDIAFADTETFEEFGGLIDVAQDVEATGVIEEASYDPIVPINALRVDVIMGQAPLFELDDEPMTTDKPVADPVSNNVQSSATTSAVTTMIPAIAFACRKSKRRGPAYENRGEFIPE